MLHIFVVDLISLGIIITIIIDGYRVLLMVLVVVVVVVVVVLVVVIIIVVVIAVVVVAAVLSFWETLLLSYRLCLR
jgi:hypothetical protein